jgi:uncharacterized membrane protein
MIRHGLPVVINHDEATALAELAEALFCSSLQPSDLPTAEEIRQAVTASLRAYDYNIIECACRMAEGYGECPEAACVRMRWCRAAVGAAYEFTAPRTTSATPQDGSG